MRKLLSVLLVGAALSSCSKKDPDPAPAPAPHVDPDKPDVPPTPPEEPGVVKGDNGKKYYTGLVHDADEFKGLGEVHMQFADGECDNLPENFDLRTLGVVPTVKDQGQCGSCWAFSKTGALESALMQVGKILNLSEQELVSNDRSQWGCDGGLLSNFKYQIDHGQGLEVDFPYTARNSPSRTIPVAAKGTGFFYVGSPDRAPTEKEVKCAMYKYKTVPWVTADASAWGSPPSSERTPFARCGSGQTNHAIGSVGWWKNGNVSEWIMKNSWGTAWGDHGYMSLPHMCGNFQEEVAFIQVAQPPGPTPTPGPGPDPTPTPPSPCIPPKIKLPVMALIHPGDEIMLGVRPTAGWTYQWFADGVIVPNVTEAMYYVAPSKDTVYKLVASSSCGTAESSEKVSFLLGRSH